MTRSIGRVALLFGLPPRHRERRKWTSFAHRHSIAADGGVRREGCFHRTSWLSQRNSPASVGGLSRARLHHVNCRDRLERLRCRLTSGARILSPSAVLLSSEKERVSMFAACFVLSPGKRPKVGFLSLAVRWQADCGVLSTD